MENSKPPIRVLSPGRVYRNEDISVRSYCLFHQIEGLYVDSNVKFSDLKGTLDYFARQFFGSSIKTRFRPSYFPFTEPSAEVDVQWRGKWLEVMGCGMVDPAVLEGLGLDSDCWSGFAAGLGVERFCMVHHEIDDIRRLYTSDLRFLEQF